MLSNFFCNRFKWFLMKKDIYVQLQAGKYMETSSVRSTMEYRVPDEILLSVFRYLNTDSLIVVKQVNKRLATIASDPSLYTAMEFQHASNVSAPRLHRYISKYSSVVTSLTLRDCAWITSCHMVESLLCCTKLQHLCLIGSKVSVKGVIAVMKSNVDLKKLGWTVPASNVPLLLKNGKPSSLHYDIQTALKKLKGLHLQFESRKSFEEFLRVFDMKDFFVYEFSISYITDATRDVSQRSSFFGIGTEQSVHIKCKKSFQVCFSDLLVANKYFRFSLGIMDFVTQSLSKAATSKQICTLLAPGATQSVFWRYNALSFDDAKSFERIDLSNTNLGVEETMWLSKLPRLSHLNLSNVGSFQPEIIKNIFASGFGRNILVLNLSRCHDCIDHELQGLRRIAQNCEQLQQLNLTGLHIHQDDEAKQQRKQQANTFCDIISKMTKLRGLALPACSLAFDIESRENQRGGNCEFEKIAKRCKQLIDLEIVDPGFQNFGQLMSNDEEYFCPITSQLRYETFSAIAQIKNLQKLTLAGLSGVLSSLRIITDGCHLIEDLSITHCTFDQHKPIDLISNELPKITHLRKFRVDQPSYVVDNGLFAALSQCKRLETLCIISRNGQLTAQPSTILEMFENCKKLVGFFMFCRFSLNYGKNVKRKLLRVVGGGARPSLCVVILPYEQALRMEGLESVPHHYLRDVVAFQSKVAQF